VTRDVCARCVEDDLEVHGREEVLDELYAELALHEVVPSYLSNEAREHALPR